MSLGTLPEIDDQCSVCGGNMDTAGHTCLECWRWVFTGWPTGGDFSLTNAQMEQQIRKVQQGGTYAS